VTLWAPWASLMLYGRKGGNKVERRAATAALYVEIVVLSGAASYLLIDATGACAQYSK
jgi:hypothetical protein